MRLALPVFVGLLAVGAGAASADDKGDKKVPPALDFTLKGLDGKDVNLAKYQGKVVLIVNVASQCGYTPQYKGLQALYEKYADKGLVVLGVPSNDFGRQEPGSSGDIAEFCEKNYGVKFPMTEKVVVKGADQTPLYKFLTSAETNPKFAGPVKWNFNKFLIGRNGEVVGRFDSGVKPESEKLVQAVEGELAKQ
jgi:glutathione peroxidase